MLVAGKGYFIFRLQSILFFNYFSIEKRGIEPRPKSSNIKVKISASEIAFFVVFVAPVGEITGEHKKCLGIFHCAGDVAFGANGKGVNVANCNFDSDSADAGEFRFESGFALVGVGHARILTAF